MNSFATEHDMTRIIILFHSESTAFSNNISISYWSYWWKLSKIGENPFIIDLPFHQNSTIFAMCSKHWTFYISRLAIFSWTEWCKRFCHSMYGCWDIIVLCLCSERIDLTENIIIYFVVLLSQKPLLTPVWLYNLISLPHTSSMHSILCTG